MGKLTYSALVSLDGYIEDVSGDFEWAAPSDEVHQLANDLERSIGTHLLGRRMYETMAVWETDPSLAAESAIGAEYAELWQAADKIVYSSTLEETATRRTRIERSFAPDAVRALKESAESDLSIGGAELASRAFAAGLVDECHFLVKPLAIGAGKPALPTEARVILKLLDHRTFADGTVHLHYGVR